MQIGAPNAIVSSVVDITDMSHNARLAALEVKREKMTTELLKLATIMMRRNSEYKLKELMNSLTEHELDRVQDACNCIEWADKYLTTWAKSSDSKQTE